MVGREGVKVAGMNDRSEEKRVVVTSYELKEVAMAAVEGAFPRRSRA